jgi:hypothetical protein
MLLPNGDQAIVEDAKLLDYCLSTTHPRGRHKARLFGAALGMTAQHAGALKAALLDAARTAEATPTRQGPFGQFYEIRFRLSGPSRTADVLSVWIVPDPASPPRLVTCYPL